MVRKYRLQDFDNAYKLDIACFEPGIAYSRPELRYYLQHPHSISLVAEHAGEMAGFIVAKRQRGSISHLITIDIASSARRKGVGTLLLESLERELGTLNCTLLVLEVAVDNAPALKFYHRHGFVVQKTIPRYYLNKIDALQMTKSIKTAAKPASAMKKG